ncbi:pentapeptide repeat-containing protein [Streptomyces sp. SID3343]|uniref:pentapeptide repeat-containing protein n=1 Tax=Streptomyces sp. SID3343 TaxID=2690260 RepID=UPI00136FA925|nr:pentapeptide repeat-containing protein [Streptomyces sp. SID3343]MYW06712.1 pentapeptide repeat-containing protein [Streptomyces sp. SID3343]
MTSPPLPSPSPPAWTHCASGATTTNPVGCRGVRVPGSTGCLAHLTPTDRISHLTGLSPGDDIDYRGTTFTHPLLNDLLAALHDPATGGPRFGAARFEHASFSDVARFDGASFAGAVRFDHASFSHAVGFEQASFSSTTVFDHASFFAAMFAGASFSADIRFEHASFSRMAHFDGASFAAAVRFDHASFSAEAQFNGVTFSGDTRFSRAVFAAQAEFWDASFSNAAWFEHTSFRGPVGFEHVSFSNAAWFGGASFSDVATFSRASFARSAQFEGASFAAEAHFEHATFSDTASFSRTIFTGQARFDRTTLNGPALFFYATFHDHAWFGGATFHNEAWFGGAAFTRDVRLTNTRFAAAGLGPLVVGGRLDLSRAVFEVPVTIEAAAPVVLCRRTRWDATATLRLRHALLDLTDAVVTHPLSVATHHTPFTTHNGTPLPETLLTTTTPSPSPDVRVASLRGVDTAHLVLTDTDLAGCRFTGAVHLDQVRLTGRTRFAPAPTGVHWHHLVSRRWTRRRVLAEEHHWRATRTPPTNPTAPTDREWTPGPHHPDPDQTPGPDDIAPVYRDLRKAFEDNKNEPDAADFYYGEMEMRRNDPERPCAERTLVTLYWAVSGYGLRATRAVTWLVLTMTVTILSLMWWGLPTNDTTPRTTGTLPMTGQPLDLHTDSVDPVVSGPIADRLTAKRARKATHVAVNSVFFRASGQDLTPTGSEIEMASRFLEPVLLALAVLAIRSRVKR